MMKQFTPTAKLDPIQGPLLLKCSTDPAWLPMALEQFDRVLVDHAHCEKKAAAQALSLLQAYPEVDGLALQMARLAREESGHLAQVIQLLLDRRLSLGRDLGDPYAQRLQRVIRNPTGQRRLDRFLVSAVIEARSSERLSLLASALPDLTLRSFYRELALSEVGHQSLFFGIATRCQQDEDAGTRLDAILDAEAEILTEVGIRPAIH